MHTILLNCIHFLQQSEIQLACYLILWFCPSYQRFILFILNCIPFLQQSEIQLFCYLILWFCLSYKRLYQVCNKAYNSSKYTRHVIRNCCLVLDRRVLSCLYQTSIHQPHWYTVEIWSFKIHYVNNELSKL